MVNGYKRNNIVGNMKANSIIANPDPVLGNHPVLMDDIFWTSVLPQPD